MLRRVFTGVLAGGLFLLLGGTAVAAPQTETTRQKNVVETFVDVVPSCVGGGPLYTITMTSNSIEHSTVFDDGRVHAMLPRRGPSSPRRWTTPACRASPASSPPGAASTTRAGP